MISESLNTERKLRLAGIVRESIVDGPGIRFVVFCQGCPHLCPGCHNAVTHDFNGGYDCSIDKILEAIDENPLLDGVTFSGGEPACQSAGFLALAKEIKERNLHIVMYSGYTYEELTDMSVEDASLDELLHIVDVLVDGRYEVSERDLTLAFRGSRNQRPIDLVRTWETGKVSLAEKF
ncbi:anaerobic ribonucleoside-triphosphate reductase activating protein [Ihubacter sp. rT4E-8]|uniref:anaerobic ribonucleoside-triphosphate reductase activating protein n=1 Tax=unclassified Ihubacter TaxID=2633299 RepID=UPI003C7A8F57